MLSGFTSRWTTPCPWAAPDAFRQRLAFDVGHREEHEFADLFDRVNWNHVGVGELRGGARLAQKPLAQLGIGCLRRWQQLDRDGPIQPDFPRQIDDAHATTAQLALERVAAGDRTLEVQE